MTNNKSLYHLPLPPPAALGTPSNRRGQGSNLSNNLNIRKIANHSPDWPANTTLTERRSPHVPIHPLHPHRGGNHQRPLPWPLLRVHQIPRIPHRGRVRGPAGGMHGADAQAMRGGPGRDETEEGRWKQNYLICPADPCKLPPFRI